MKFLNKHCGAILPMLIICALITLCLTGCPQKKEVVIPTAHSGVKEAYTKVDVGSDGLTSEQRNVKNRLIQDNKPGAIKHLYVFSAASGQCIMYSTVREKVTSSGKRLSPTTVATGASYNSNNNAYNYGVPVSIGGRSYNTGEVLQDDGTYGHSIEYLYWFDANGTYRQLYPSAGAMVVVSTVPLPVKAVTVNIESKVISDK